MSLPLPELIESIRPLAERRALTDVAARPNVRPSPAWRLMGAACRAWQRLFRPNHPKLAELDELFADPEGDLEPYFRAYFEWEARPRAFPAIDSRVDRWNDKRVLDYGCGVGGLAFALAGRCQQATGLEIQQDMVGFGNAELARRGCPNAELLHYDGRTIPLPDASVDAIFCIDVIEHVADPASTLRELHRVLRPGGLLRLEFGPPWYHPHGKHLWTKLPGWWTHLLFPRGVVMEHLGHPPETTWQDLGMNGMTYSRLRKLLAASPLQQLEFNIQIRPLLSPIASIPLLREFWIGAVDGVWTRPN